MSRQAALTDPHVSLTKFRRDLTNWKTNPDAAARGWLLLDVNEDVPSVEVAFTAKLSTSAQTPLPAIVCAVRISYENYDLVPPSVTFIDAFTRKPALPHVRAIQGTPEGPRDVLIDGHPTTGQAFLCLPGIREYHTHPQHTGDDWLLHRSSHAGALWTICERIWRLMVRNVVGLHLSTLVLPGVPMRAQVSIQILQGDIEGLATGLATTPTKGGEHQ